MARQSASLPAWCLRVIIPAMMTNRLIRGLFLAQGLALCLAAAARAEVVPPPGMDVYVLSEVHDNPAHHAEQARLVDDLQQLSRVETGQLALHIETFDLVSVAQRVAMQLRPQLIAQSLDVIVELPDGRWWFDAHRGRK